MTLRQLVPVRRIVAVSETLEALARAANLAPFAPELLEFCAKLSRALFTDPRCRRTPDIQALAFRMRPAELRRLEDSFRATVSGSPALLQPRGLALHIAPANVDTMFVYSWLFSALMGNRNLVRVSDNAPESSLLLCSIFGEVLEEASEPVRRSVAIVQYGHDPAINGAVSAACDVRVIWGGDETVRTIRATPLAPRATELVFADRYSFAIIGAAAYNGLDEKKRAELADRFFNDTFWFDQMACSSPRLVIWYGLPGGTERAARVFFEELERAVDRKGYSAGAGARLNRFAFGCRAALDGPVSAMQRFHGRFETLTLTELTPFCREHCGGGLLYQFHTGTLAPVAQFVSRRDQTATYFGLAGEELCEMATLMGARGVDRVVPIGQALEFGRYWDGYDLFLELTRHVDVRREVT